MVDLSTKEQKDMLWSEETEDPWKVFSRHVSQFNISRSVYSGISKVPSRHSTRSRSAHSPVIYYRIYGRARRDSPRLIETTKKVEELRTRLANANAHFGRMAGEVFNDEAARGLLAHLYEAVVVDLDQFDGQTQGIALAKLTAAGFAEIGPDAYFITGAGRRFVDSIGDVWKNSERPPKPRK